MGTKLLLVLCMQAFQEKNVSFGKVLCFAACCRSGVLCMWNSPAVVDVRCLGAQVLVLLVATVAVVGARPEPQGLDVEPGSAQVNRV